MNSNVETIRDIYRAINRNDIPAALKCFDPEIERREFEGSPSASTCLGIEEFKAHLKKGRDGWAEGSCEPEQFFEAEKKIVVLVHVRVRLKSEPEWREGKVADGFAFENGLVTEFHSFTHKQDALKWAGIAFKN